MIWLLLLLNCIRFERDKRNRHIVYCQFFMTGACTLFSGLKHFNFDTKTVPVSIFLKLFLQMSHSSPKILLFFFVKNWLVNENDRFIIKLFILISHFFIVILRDFLSFSSWIDLILVSNWKRPWNNNSSSKFYIKMVSSSFHQQIPW